MTKMNSRVYHRCPMLFGARTAGELQKELRRRTNRRFSLTDCYFLLCGQRCFERPCCRPDYDDKGGRQ
jgi:hypothetical protein